MRVVVILIMAGLLLLSCGKNAEDKTAADPSLGLNDQELLMKASKILVGKFGKELKGELLSSLNEGGPQNAIDICQIKAPEIAAANSNESWTIRRVSDRSRNRDNLANYHELAILVRFDDTTGNTPEYIFEWAQTDDGKVYRHYRPIKIAPLCVKCHGAADEITPEVQALLNERYPDDRAIGYKPDDLRGMFVVEVKWPQGKAYAQKLVAETP